MNLWLGSITKASDMWKYKIQLKIVADQSVGIVDVHYYDKEGKDLYKD